MPGDTFNSNMQSICPPTGGTTPSSPRWALRRLSSFGWGTPRTPLRSTRYFSWEGWISAFPCRPWTFSLVPARSLTFSHEVGKEKPALSALVDNGFFNIG
jgi:hypothetical protein